MSEKALLQAESYTVEQIERETDDAATGTNEQQKEADGVKIEGLAIPFNKRSRNGVVYETESLKNAAETLVGCSILFNHDDNEPLGHVKDVEVTNEGIRYEGDLNPERRETESLKRGDIPNVSIQAMIEESEDSKADVAVTEFLELSAVTVPGYPSTTVDAEGVMVESLVENNMDKLSEDFSFEIGDMVMWEFGDGSAKGEIIDRTDETGDSLSAGGNEFTLGEDDDALYKMQEWDNEVGEFTNNVVKFEDALSSTDRPDDAPSSAPRNESVTEQPDDITYEFEPIPKLVLYDNEADARQRAQDLGVEGIHQHQVNDEQYWMAGQTHGQWRQLVGLQENIESTSSESFDDYPQAAQENARQALEAKENSEYDNDDCGTQVGWERANQLDNGENLSEETVQRMHSFFERHDGDQEVDEGDMKEEDCGWLTWQAWGGDEAFDWATEKLEEIEDSKKESKSKEPFAGYDDFDACVADNQDKQNPEAYCAAIKKKAEILGEKTTMTEENENTTKEQLENVAEDDFLGTIADMYEDLSASDVGELFEEFEFSSNPEPLVAQLADVASVTPADLMEVLEDMAEEEMDDEEEPEDESGDMEDDDMEDEGDYSDDEEEEESNGSESSNKNRESQEGSNDMSSKTREELENRIKQLEETIMEMEETEPSKQEAANTPSNKDSSGITVTDELKNKFSR